MDIIDMDEINELNRRFFSGLKRFFAKDSFLLEKKAGERAIAHKLAEYLQMAFPEWQVDCEYNRKLDQVKTRLDGSKVRPFIPDIIIHNRGREGRENNLLFIEVKKKGARGNHEDERLKDATIFPYKYHLGLFVKFHIGNRWREIPEISYYADGREIRIVQDGGLGKNTGR